MTRKSLTFLSTVLLAGAVGAALPVFNAVAEDGLGAGPCQGQRGAMRERAARMFEDRQIVLHERLELTSEQEAAWQRYTEKMKPAAGHELPDARTDEQLSAPARLEAALAAMKAHQDRMAERLAAVKEFYAVLTPEQQKIFDAEFHPPLKRFGHHHRHHMLPL